MTTHRNAMYVGVSILIAAAVVFGLIRAFPRDAAAATQKQIHVRWLLSHQPTDVFTNATRVFSQTLEKESGGAMTLEVVTPQEVGVQAGDVPSKKVFELLDSGAVQLATDYTVALGQQDHDLWALNLPYLFNAYGELPGVLDGTAGQGLLAGLAQKTTARGLAFTMSGGLRIIVSKDKAISSPADLKGLRIGTSGGPVAEETLKALGAIPVPLDLESGNAALDPKTLDGIETTYSRLSEVIGKQTEYTKYVSETDHSMFLTAILASNAFYDSLSSQNQTALRDAALAAAQVERHDSIALADRTHAQLAAQGSIVTTLSDAQKNAFKKATAPVYAHFNATFWSSLMSALSDR